MRGATAGKAWQEACGANSRGGRAAARVRAGTWAAGGRREGGGGERAGAPRSCCRRRSRRCSEEAMLCGVWGGGRRRSKAERGDGRDTTHTRHKMAGEAAARRAVRRSAAAAGPVGRRGPVPGRPAGPRRRSGRGWGETGRAPGSGPAAEAPGAAGPTTLKAPLRQRPRRLPGAPAARPGAGGGPARALDAGDLEVPAAALVPGEWLPGPFYCPLSLGGKAKCP